MLDSSTRRVGVPRSYMPTPQSFYTPSIPAIERHLSVQFSSPEVVVLRLLRFSWFLATLPIHLVVVTIAVLLPSLAGFIPAFLLPRSHLRRRWTKRQRYLYPIISRLLWVGPGTGGGPPLITPEAERAIPVNTILLERFFPDKHKVAVRVEEASPTGKEAWVEGEAVDPRGVVKPKEVPLFWLQRDVGDDDVGFRRAREGEKVVLYLVGGGYVTGSPVQGNRCYNLARWSDLRIVGVNYRKASGPDKAYPAALQDAITAYAHLVEDLGYKDIILAGDSAGGGLAMSLILYLSTTLALSKTKPDSLVLPSAVLLYSPWVDLSFELGGYGTGSLPPHLTDDFLNLTQLTYAVDAYLTNLFSAFPSDGTRLKEAYASKAEWEKSPWNVEKYGEGGKRHPLFSPALPSSLPQMQAMAKAYADEGVDPPNVLVVSGSAELFSTEIGVLVERLRGVFGDKAVE
ncbi:lipase/esterase [Pseudohyphozyma bogoriensis]|nr:lipase/esterase [Pseudohyphozyma bogoriensis]